MDVNYFNTLYRYNYWANERIQSAAERGGDIQFVTPAQYGRSIRDIMVHVMSTEWIWRSRWKGLSPAAPLDAEELPTLFSVRERWRAEEREMRAFLASLRDEDLTRVVHYTSTKGLARSYPLWQMMAHVVNHGTYHRSEAATLLTAFEHSPGDLDLVLFLDEQRRQAESAIPERKA